MGWETIIAIATLVVGIVGVLVTLLVVGMKTAAGFGAVHAVQRVLKERLNARESRLHDHGNALARYGRIIERDDTKQG
ncbi:hypothetical protein [Thioalkalivibrio sp. HK1]|uniref:hypothetical protein n=1 Tax=Thioalkalivibrio sp. HK1 TaxID=1469245 RepID=UPI0012DDFF65|nr:hypothetical protein [Thioalkalivibrio sp. HK1]